MTCEEIERGDLVEEYLLGRLPAAARDAVDAHLFECDRCFERLETFRAMRRELAATAAARRAEAARPTGWVWKWALVPAFATLVIAGVVAWPRAVLSPPLLAPAGRAAGETALALDPQPDAATRLAELGRFRPPAYEPGTFRGSQDEASARFRDAMRQYGAGDCAAAIPGLRAAAELDADAAHARFFLGICRGATGALDESARALRQTISIGDTPYLEEAHFYLALVLLQTREPAAARDHLQRAIALRGPLERRARETLAALDRLAPRP
jgi:tetratricopeptide (TPR) repeat protein